MTAEAHHTAIRVQRQYLELAFSGHITKYPKPNSLTITTTKHPGKKKYKKVVTI